MSDFGEDVGSQILQELRSGRLVNAVMQRFDGGSPKNHSLSSDAKGSLIERIDFKSEKDAAEFCRLSADYGVEARSDANTVVIRRGDFERLPVSAEIRKAVRTKAKSPRLHDEGERCRKASGALSKETSASKSRSANRGIQIPQKAR